MQKDSHMLVTGCFLPLEWGLSCLWSAILKQREPPAVYGVAAISRALSIYKHI